MSENSNSERETLMHEAIIDYTNHRGERRERHICPLGVRHAVSPYHGPKPCWLLEAFDLEKNQIRQFSMSEIHAFKNIEDSQDDST